MFGPRRNCLAAAVLLSAVVGCSTAPINLRTLQPEKFTPPPDDDPRYSQPFEYPKELLNRPPVKSSGAAGGKPGLGGGGPPGMTGGMGQN